MVSERTNDHRGRVNHLEQLEDVVSDIDVGEFRVQASEIGVVDVFEDERGGFALQKQCQRGESKSREEQTHLAIAHDIEQTDNVGAST
jgi:hypothetical protein